MVTPREACISIHPLLNDHPFAVGANDKGMKVELKAVRNRIIVDLSGQPAGAYQCIAI